MSSSPRAAAIALTMLFIGAGPASAIFVPGVCRPSAEERPTLLLTVEGGVGNRQGVLASLRCEYDFCN